jgi:VanZ family protein
VLFAPTAGGTPPFAQADKLVHLALFALLAATTRWRFGSARWLLALVAAYAVGSEIVQGATLTGRSGDVLDTLADLVGAGSGWWAAGRLTRASGRRAVSSSGPRRGA